MWFTTAIFSFFSTPTTNQEDVRQLTEKYLALVIKQNSDIDDIYAAMVVHQDDLARGGRALDQLHAAVVVSDTPVLQTKESVKFQVNNEDLFPELIRKLNEYPTLLSEKNTASDFRRLIKEREDHHAEVMKLAASFLHIEGNNNRNIDNSISKTASVI